MNSCMKDLDDKMAALWLHEQKHESDMEFEKDAFAILCKSKEPKSANISDSFDGSKVSNAKKKPLQKMKVCAGCQIKEEIPKTFKKCSRCVEEGFSEPRYYCSKQCQVEDWIEIHKEEHNLHQKNT